MVILKSELASKLIGHDPERAASEIRDVEQISREALAEVRNAIGGYRAGGLEEELARAAFYTEDSGRSRRVPIGARASIAGPGNGARAGRARGRD